ncbi:DUF4225 domain-containing protein [Serratia ureilytica]|uniref:DUF4225 domain-containing protein n=1 Tax=Serratia ureilytica TaxID=300181 RepID=UPI001AA11347|nr:DUF4225 domain-containing protein [Serratia ureilytica]MBO1811543.1 DUF4225 domain-containing protein [Serratia ureilytica]
MYLAVPPGQKTIAWSEMALDREVRKLVNIANTVSASHLKDGLTRFKFVEEIRGLITQQLTALRKAKSIDAYTQATQVLQAETANLLEQDRLIRTKAAQLYAKVEFVKENNEIVGYVISAVSVVLAGFEIVAGVALFGTMTPVGMLAGATLVLDGLNGISKEINNNLLGKQESQGVFADGATSAAEFLGFQGNTGLAVYNGISLAANVYGVFGLIRKQNAWRLFHYVPQDFYRKVSSMSRPMLTMKIVGYGLKAKIVFDLLTTDKGD